MTTTKLLTSYTLAPIWVKILISFSLYFIIFKLHYIDFSIFSADCMQEGSETVDFYKKKLEEAIQAKEIAENKHQKAEEKAAIYKQYGDEALGLFLNAKEQVEELESSLDLQTKEFKRASVEKETELQNLRERLGLGNPRPRRRDPLDILRDSNAKYEASRFGRDAVPIKATPRIDDALNALAAPPQPLTPLELAVQSAREDIQRVKEENKKLWNDLFQAKIDRDLYKNKSQYYYYSKSTQTDTSMFSDIKRSQESKKSSPEEL